MTRLVERLLRDKTRDHLDGFQCICSFYTPNPDIAADHFHSRGKGPKYRAVHHTLVYVREGINLLSKKPVAKN